MMNEKELRVAAMESLQHRMNMDTDGLDIAADTINFLSYQFNVTADELLSWSGSHKVSADTSQRISSFLYDISNSLGCEREHLAQIATELAAIKAADLKELKRIVYE